MGSLAKAFNPIEMRHLMAILCDIFFNLLQSKELFIIIQPLHLWYGIFRGKLNLLYIVFHPGYLIVQYLRILYDLEDFIQSFTDLYEPIFGC